jgi:hypothetical protein
MEPTQPVAVPVTYSMTAWSKSPQRTARAMAGVPKAVTATRKFSGCWQWGRQERAA